MPVTRRRRATCWRTCPATSVPRSGSGRSARSTEESGGGLRALWRAKWVRPALLVATGLAVFQQLVGINTIIYYAPTTLTNVGFAKTSAIYANLIIGVINVGMTVIAIRIVDRVGRKPMLFAGVAGMAGSLLVLGISLSVLPTPHHPVTRRRSSRSFAWPRSSRRSPRHGDRWSG